MSTLSPNATRLSTGEPHLPSRVETQDIKILFTWYNRAMFLLSPGQIL